MRAQRLAVSECHLALLLVELLLLRGAEEPGRPRWGVPRCLSVRAGPPAPRVFPVVLVPGALSRVPGGLLDGLSSLPAADWRGAGPRGASAWPVRRGREVDGAPEFAGRAGLRVGVVFGLPPERVRVAGCSSRAN